MIFWFKSTLQMAAQTGVIYVYIYIYIYYNILVYFDQPDGSTIWVHIN